MTVYLLIGIGLLVCLGIEMVRDGTDDVVLGSKVEFLMVAVVACILFWPLVLTVYLADLISERT